MYQGQHSYPPQYPNNTQVKQPERNPQPRPGYPNETNYGYPKGNEQNSQRYPVDQRVLEQKVEQKSAYRPVPPQASFQATAYPMSDPQNQDIYQQDYPQDQRTSSKAQYSEDYYHQPEQRNGYKPSSYQEDQRNGSKVPSYSEEYYYQPDQRNVSKPSYQEDQRNGSKVPSYQEDYYHQPDQRTASKPPTYPEDQRNGSKVPSYPEDYYHQPDQRNVSKPQYSEDYYHQTDQQTGSKPHEDYYNQQYQQSISKAPYPNTTYPNNQKPINSGNYPPGEQNPEHPATGYNPYRGSNPLDQNSEYNPQDPKLQQQNSRANYAEEYYKSQSDPYGGAKPLPKPPSDTYPNYPEIKNPSNSSSYSSRNEHFGIPVELLNRKLPIGPIPPPVNVNNNKPIPKTDQLISISVLVGGAKYEVQNISTITTGSEIKKFLKTRYLVNIYLLNIDRLGKTLGDLQTLSDINAQNGENLTGWQQLNGGH